ncbi:hypothetical protein ACVWXN_005935 [Bradyrhizobium sp. i1.4.4]|uniref:hypothetical protein n=1 Tax=unclassified Bradyrhizobium TaxID=2631580 RepID=UPI0033939EAD
MTMLNRSAPDTSPTLALTATEIGVLDRLVNDKPISKTESALILSDPRSPGSAVISPAPAIRDPPPGSTVLWRGLSRLTAIALGAMVGGELV